MKRIGLLILVALTAVGAFGQSADMACGSVPLSLGMPQAQVMQSLEGAGFGYIPIKSARTRTYYERTSQESCEVGFADGRLAYIARDWEKHVNTPADALTNVVSALNSITNGQSEQCRVFPRQHTSPEMSRSEIGVSCGSRTVKLTYGSFEGSPFYDIEESIGEYPSR